MIDQAEKLRQIIENFKQKQSESNVDLLCSKNRNAKVITITSGKGGVGKTNITINLAIALSEQGHRVTILDADLGLANIDVLFGIIPQFTLLDIIQEKRNILEVMSDGPKNVKFISGGSGIEELTKLTNMQLESFIKKLSLLDKISDVILIDTGAGVSDNVMSFVMAADEVILVTTPEPTSITDAYALIKMISNRDNKKVIKVIANRSESDSEAEDLFKKLTVVTERFLELKLYPLGHILRDDLVIQAVKLQQPFILEYPKSTVSKQIRDISKKLININEVEVINESKGIKGFIGKLVKLLGNEQNKAL